MTSQLPAIDLIEPTGAYAAGACNIGPAEIARRRRSGWIGLGATVGLAITLVAIGAPPVARLTIGLPAYIAAIGFIQARQRFCVGFALAGITNFEALGIRHRVGEVAARSADRRHAWSLVLRSAAIAVAVALLFAVLPR